MALVAALGMLSAVAFAGLLVYAAWSTFGTIWGLIVALGIAAWSLNKICSWVEP